MTPTMPGEKNLSADIFSDATGKKWTAVLEEHPANGGPGVEVWRREGMRSERNAELAMDAAYRRLQARPAVERKEGE